MSGTTYPPPQLQQISDPSTADSNFSITTSFVSVRIAHPSRWGYSICALRPTGIYGIARPVESSKWFDLIQAVVQGQVVKCRRGGKEVHAADVARAVEILLTDQYNAERPTRCGRIVTMDGDHGFTRSTIAAVNSAVVNVPPKS